MKIIIKAKNIELTEDIKRLVEEKFLSLKKFIGILKKDVPENLKTLAEIFIELQKETQHHKKGDVFLANAELSLPGKKIIALARQDTLEKAVSEAKNEMKMEIEKYKLKKIEKTRRSQKLAKKNI